MSKKIILTIFLFVFSVVFLHAQTENSFGISFFNRIEIIDFFPSQNNIAEYSSDLRYMNTTGVEINVLLLSERFFPYITLAYSTDFIKRFDQLCWGEGLYWALGGGAYLIGNTQQQSGFSLTVALGYSMKVLFQSYYETIANSFYYSNRPFMPIGGEAAIKANYNASFAVFSIGFVFAFYHSDKMIGFSSRELNDGWALSYGINLSYGFNL